MSNSNNLTEQYFSYSHPLVPLRERFSYKARMKMYEKFIAQISPDAHAQILDVGATPDTRLKDSNFLEKTYPYSENITVVSIEDCSNLVTEYGLKAFYLNEPKKPLPFPDEAFDVLFCSATLEHVGARTDQEYFLKECLRVSKSLFLTTPNRYFPLEMHTFLPFLHWLPWGMFQKIVLKLCGPFYASIDNLNLLSARNLREMIEKVSGAGDLVHMDFIRTVGVKSNLILVVKRG